MDKLEEIKNWIKNIAEFSTKTYCIVGYVIVGIMTIAGGSLLYVVTTDTLVFKVNWNMFSSPLGTLCWMIFFMGESMVVRSLVQNINLAGFPIESSIIENDNMGSIEAVYKNLKYGTIMNLDGESLPAQAGDITIYGRDGDIEWFFNLT